MNINQFNYVNKKILFFEFNILHIYSNQSHLSLDLWEVVTNRSETIFVSNKGESVWFSFIVYIWDSATDYKRFIFSAKVFNDSFFRSGDTITGFIAVKKSKVLKYVLPFFRIRYIIKLNAWKCINLPDSVSINTNIFEVTLQDDSIFRRGECSSSSACDEGSESNYLK